MINTTARSVSYDISGGAVGSYPIPFPYSEAADIKASGQLPDGSLTPLVYGVDYSVAGATFTRITSYAAYVALLIYRETTLVQLAEFRNGDILNGPDIEEALDRTVMQLQENRDNSSKAVIAPLDEDAIGPLPTAAGRAGRILAFNAAGDPDTTLLYVVANDAMSPILSAATILDAQKALGLLPAGASSPINADCRDFLAAGNSTKLKIGANGLGKTYLQEWLDAVGGGLKNVETVTGADYTITGSVKIIRSSGGVLSLTQGAGVQVGDLVEVVNTTASDIVVIFESKSTTIPSQCVEWFIYNPGRAALAGRSWQPLVLNPEAYDDPASPIDIQVATKSFVMKKLAVMAVSAWVTRTSAADNSWYSVCWSPELGLFCAVAYTGSGNRVMTSPDGTTWTIRASAADNGWGSVCWSPELGLFCAVAYSGTGNRVMTSPNGITWTIRASAADNNWYSVCWSPELGLFCAVAYSGTGNRVMTSPDGITWTIRASAADNGWYSVCWSPELGLFCAVADSGTGNRVMTSPDGITWTIRASAADNGWRSVCWSPKLGLFCAVAYSGTGNRVMTSPDGITWTIRASAADNGWRSVCWSPELGLFCAVAYTGTGNLVMTSPDGITWTIRASAADNNWGSVCWSPKLGLFCSVAYSGTGNRVMTTKYPIV